MSSEYRPNALVEGEDIEDPNTVKLHTIQYWVPKEFEFHFTDAKGVDPGSGGAKKRLIGATCFVMDVEYGMDARRGLP